MGGAELNSVLAVSVNKQSSPQFQSFWNCGVGQLACLIIGLPYTSGEVSVLPIQLGSQEPMPSQSASVSHESPKFFLDVHAGVIAGHVIQVDKSVDKILSGLVIDILLAPFLKTTRRASSKVGHI